MRTTPDTSAQAPLHETVFHLNLHYLWAAQQIAAQDPRHAEAVLGLRDPLTAWLPQASIDAVACLASCPLAFYTLRLPRTANERILRGCEKGLWITPVQAGLAALGVPRGRPR
jgi:hypothetical protein